MYRSQWKEENDKSMANFAKGITTEKLSYGDKVYESSYINGVGWKVFSYANEFNVFMVSDQGRNTKYTLVKTYYVKKSAIKFAMEMLLVANGYLKRNSLKGH